jgi:hypothetical protein
MEINCIATSCIAGTCPQDHMSSSSCCAACQTSHMRQNNSWFSSRHVGQHVKSSSYSRNSLLQQLCRPARQASPMAARLLLQAVTGQPHRSRTKVPAGCCRCRLWARPATPPLSLCASMCPSPPPPPLPCRCVAGRSLWLSTCRWVGGGMERRTGAGVKQLGSSCDPGQCWCLRCAATPCLERAHLPPAQHPLHTHFAFTLTAHPSPFPLATHHK